MANEEYVKILRQGVKVWNKWRKDNPDVKPDLREAILSGAILVGANLSNVNLVEANLVGAFLSRTDLCGADLSGANLVRANLYMADLSGANLYMADLSGAALSEANLTKANFYKARLINADLKDANLKDAHLPEANLRGANLSDADLSEADLRDTNLTKTNLSGANLSRAKFIKANLSGVDLVMAYLSVANLGNANLRGANLSEADLSEANLSWADLSWADLSWANLNGAGLWNTDLTDANLQNADLRWSQLVECNLTNAVLTGCKLYGTARDDWVIKGVKCSYIFFDQGGKVQLPKGREFKKGEFEKLYASLPTIEYFFQNGFTPIDPVIMAKVVQAIQEKEPDFGIQIDSINARGLVPSMKFIIQKEEQKDAALEKVTTEYEGLVKQLEGERDRYYALLMEGMKAPRDIKLINAAPGSIVATDGSTVKIEQHIHHCVELQKVISNEPESESFGKTAKKKAMDIIGAATEDVAKGLVKEAGKKIVELGIELGPVLMKTAAYAFFKSMLG